VAGPLLRWTVLLVVLAVLLVGVDQVASRIVTRQTALGLRMSQGLSTSPVVTFVGRPFLTQAVRGRYRQVDVEMTGVPTEGPLVVDRLDTSLYGVRAAALPSLRGELTDLPVERGEADAYASFPALQRAATEILRGQGITLTLGYGAADRVTFTARIGSPVGVFTVKGQTRITVAKGAVVVRLLPDTLTGVPALLRSQVAAQVDLSGLVPALPFGFRATRVAVTPQGLRLHAAGTSLTIPV
jgi:hypothetical protein